MKIRITKYYFLAFVAIGMQSCRDSNKEAPDAVQAGSEVAQEEVSVSDEDVQALSEETSRIKLVNFSQLLNKLEVPTIVALTSLPVDVAKENPSLSLEGIRRQVKDALPVSQFSNKGVSTFLVTYITGQSVTYSTDSYVHSQHRGIIIETRLLSHAVAETDKDVYAPVLAELGRSTRVLTGHNINNSKIESSIRASVNEIFAVNSSNELASKLIEIKLSKEASHSFLEATIISMQNTMLTLRNLMSGNPENNMVFRDNVLSPPANIPFSMKEGLNFSARDVPKMSASSLSAFILAGGQDAADATEIWESSLGSIIKNNRNSQNLPELTYSLKTHELGWSGKSYTNYNIGYTSITHPSVLFSSKQGIFATPAVTYSSISQVIDEANSRVTIEKMVRQDAISFTKAIKSNTLWQEQSVSGQEIIKALDKEFLDVKQKAMNRLLPDMQRWVESRCIHPVSDSLNNKYALYLTKTLIKHFPREELRRELFYYKEGFKLSPKGSENGRDRGRLNRFYSEARLVPPLISSLYPDLFRDYTEQTELGAYLPNTWGLIQKSSKHKNSVLSKVKVRDLFSIIMETSRNQASYHPENIELLKNLKPLEKELTEAKILDIEYTGPKGTYYGGKRSYVWYGIKPHSWLKIRETLTGENFKYLKECLDGRPQLSPCVLYSDQVAYQAAETTSEVPDQLATELTDSISLAIEALKNESYDTSKINILCEHLRLINKRGFRPIRTIPQYAVDLIDSAVDANVPSALIYKAESCMEWNGKGYVASAGQLEKVLAYLKKAAELDSGEAYYWLAELTLSEEIKGGRLAANDFAEKGAEFRDLSSIALLKLIEIEDKGLLRKQPREVELSIVKPVEAGVRVGNPLSIYVNGRNTTKLTTRLREKTQGYQRARILGEGRAAPPKF